MKEGKKPYSEGFELGGEVKRLRKYTMKANKPGLAIDGGQDMCPDLSQLENMHEAGILHCMRMRFTDGKLEEEMIECKYTAFIGDICIAVNPFAPYPYAGSKAWVQYDANCKPDWEYDSGQCKSYNMQHYIDAKPDVRSNPQLEPHCWSVADLAYTTLQKVGKNQAVLICGESGAGKTECCKFVLTYLMAKKVRGQRTTTGRLCVQNSAFLVSKAPPCPFRLLL